MIEPASNGHAIAAGSRASARLRTQGAAGRGEILGVAAFLASSWTWCIGMFLPILLLRDFGPWSFLVFALPNCIGAALMGWILRRPGASEAFIGAHRRACILFSLVTIGFHSFFLLWITQNSTLAWAVVAGFIANIAINILCSQRQTPGWMPAILTYAISLLCAAVMGWQGALGAAIEAPPLLPAADLLWLAPICIFGFVFCPYLDLSFHVARQTLPGSAGTRAFIAGFGGLFLGMIILTLAYAGMFLRADPAMATISTTDIAQLFGTAATAALLLHISSQAAFTIHLHIGMVSRAVHGLAWKADWRIALAILLPIALGILSPQLPTMGGHYPGSMPMSGGEAIYRGFMGFYGLVFPAYFWLCVLPGWGKPGWTRPSRHQMLVFAGAVGIAMPMFYMGFIERQSLWLGIGLGVVLLARLFAKSAPRPE